MELAITFREPLVSCSRDDVEEVIEQWLGEHGEIIGAGNATDGSWSHIDIDFFQAGESDIQRIVTEITPLLIELQVPQRTELLFLDDEGTLGKFNLYEGV